MSSQPEPSPWRLQALLWVGGGLLALTVAYQLGPILTPFLLAAILAYVFNPVVDRLQQLRLPRLAGVVVVLVLIIAIVVALALVLVPLLVEEAAAASARLPEAVALLNERLLPWLRERFGLKLSLDAASLKQIVSENWSGLQGILQKLVESLKIGGVALFGLIANVILTPVVMFYLLADWHALVGRLDAAVPRPWHGKVSQLAAEADAVLSAFLRGQLMVMGILAIYYSVALAIAGLPSAIAIGLLTGMLIFIPYIGYATGFLLALLVAALQFQGSDPIIGVAIVFAIGQVLESFLLTPFLVGDRIGLHPLAVIFALMAFGQLFGFFGVLLALPASAILLVGLRELHRVYHASRLYRGTSA